MIYNLSGQDLLTADVEAFVHQANCFCTMGSGIARSIREKYPEMYEADCKTEKGDKSKLGTFSWAPLPDGKIGYNLYSQYDFGRDHRKTNYEAVANGLRAIKKHAYAAGIRKLGIPKNMGCTLGGGNWGVVEAIIKAEFEHCPIDVYICEYTPVAVAPAGFTEVKEDSKP